MFLPVELFAYTTIRLNLTQLDRSKYIQCHFNELLIDKRELRASNKYSYLQSKLSTPGIGGSHMSTEHKFDHQGLHKYCYFYIFPCKFIYTRAILSYQRFKGSQCLSSRELYLQGKSVLIFKGTLNYLCARLSILV